MHLQQKYDLPASIKSESPEPSLFRSPYIPKANIKSVAPDSDDDFDYSSVFLSVSEMEAELKEEDGIKAVKTLCAQVPPRTPNSTPVSVVPHGHTPSSTPASAPPSYQAQMIDACPGWQDTPPDCRCNCKKVAYVVFHGRSPGIYTEWSRVKRATNDFSHARFKGYHSIQDAEYAYLKAVEMDLISPVPPEWENHHFTIPQLTPCLDTLLTPSTRARSPTEVTTPLSPRPQAPKTPRITRMPLSPGGSATQRRQVMRMPQTEMASPTPTHHRTFVTPTPSFPVASSELKSLQDCDNATSWWVICVGLSPGVYHGLTTAQRNAGAELKTEVYPAEGLNAANERFVDFFMSNRIQHLGTATSRLSVDPSSTPVQPTPIYPADEDAWWLVPVGGRPGVYFGRTTAARVAGSAIKSMIKCKTDVEAYSIFVDMYMAFQVQEAPAL